MLNALRIILRREIGVAAMLAMGTFATIPLRVAEAAGGYAYTLNNDVNANGVVVLKREADGTLTKTEASPFATGGRGLAVPSGGDFDTQGSIRIHGNRLFAVNPGSNTVSVFDIVDHGSLKPVAGSPFPSGGVTPLSLAVQDEILYVANQAVPFANPDRAPNITGFHVKPDGSLSPIPDSTIEYAPGQGPAQVEFSPAGDVLAVTTGFQTGGELHAYKLMSDGRLKEGPNSPYVAQDVSGTVGFSWSADGARVLLSNFRGSAVTVFNVDGKTGMIEAVGKPYANNEGAACWTALSPNGKTLYTANYVSNSISAFALQPDGTLTLLGSAKRGGGTSPDTKDLAVSPDGRYLYVVAPVAKQIAVFSVGEDRMPTELPKNKSPYEIDSGQWTTGLVVN